MNHTLSIDPEKQATKNKLQENLEVPIKGKKQTIHTPKIFEN